MNRAVVMALAGLACIAVAGPAAWGRLALWSGVSGASMFLDTPAARGLALYREGRYDEADAALAEAGRGQTFNRALTLAATGRHALSVAYFDAVLFSSPADTEARQLRDMIARMLPPVRGDNKVPGRLAIQGGLDPTKPETVSGPASTPDPTGKRPIDKSGLVATDAWLDTLVDDPGEFLRVRLRKEYERRAGLGLVRPERGERW